MVSTPTGYILAAAAGPSTGRVGFTGHADAGRCLELQVSVRKKERVDVCVVIGIGIPRHVLTRVYLPF